MTHTLESYIKERAPAQVECEECDAGVQGSGAIDDTDICTTCHGKGYRWHEAVIPSAIGTEQGPRCHFIPHLLAPNYEVPITKDSFLTRRHDVCGKCGGDKIVRVLVENKGYDISYSNRICDHCLKDENGNPTGAEPGSATPWEVER